MKNRKQAPFISKPTLRILRIFISFHPPSSMSTFPSSSINKKVNVDQGQKPKQTMGDSSLNDLKPEYRVDGSCWKFVPVISEGFFNQRPGDIFRHHLILLQLQLAVIFTLAAIIHFFLGRFYLPRLISEVLAGVILGPTVLGRFFPDISAVLFSEQSVKVLATLTRFGYLFFMFLIGVKMDVNLIKKSGKREWTIGTMVMLFPLLVTVMVGRHISIVVDKVDAQSAQYEVSFFTGVLMLTSFPVVAILLMQLKIINSELGHLTLSSALISDMVSLVMVNIGNYRVIMLLASLRVALKSLFLVAVLIVFILTVLQQMLYWIIRKTPEGKPVKDAYIFFVVIALLVVAIVGENVGLQYMYGPFILGLTVPTGHPLASTLIEKLDTIVSGWMLPLMSTYCGYRSNLWNLNRLPPYWIMFAVTFGFFLKVACGFIPAFCFKVPCKDATALALMLAAKGIVELGTFATNADKQSTVTQEFTWAVIIVFIFAALVPILTRKLYDPSKTYAGYQKRTVLNSSINEGVRMLACAHRQDDALSAIKLLQLSNPSTGSPLSVYGLYLEELVGGASPLLLNHQLGQRSSSDGGRWQPIIDVFNYFKSQSSKPTQVHVYTAISPSSLMHEDVCWVAFDNLVALIILPFHRKWNRKGKLISDSKDLRDFNTKVLNKAPCSVAILIDRDRGRNSSVIDESSTYNICVVFLGGKDDREALSIARRMKGWPSVFLTVIRLKETEDMITGWEGMMDDECLRDIKHPSNENGNVMYKEEIVRHGADTSALIGSILDENFDLICVGRHAQCDSPLIEGLSAWTDLPELGTIGDLLVSAEISKPISILVVQQQVIEK